MRNKYAENLHNSIVGFFYVVVFASELHNLHDRIPQFFCVQTYKISTTELRLTYKISTPEFRSFVRTDVQTLCNRIPTQKKCGTNTQKTFTTLALVFLILSYSQANYAIFTIEFRSFFASLRTKSPRQNSDLPTKYPRQNSEVLFVLTYKLSAIDFRIFLAYVRSATC
jgi:hypothetical protein